MTTITISVPDLSGASDVDVVEVMVKAGDVIAEGDSLIAVETDKAAMEVPAPQAGTVVEVIMQEGAVCNLGDAILTLSTDVQAAAPAAEPAPAEAAPAPVAAPAAVSGGVEDILVPDLSGATDVDVVEVMVKVGDTVAEGDSLIAVETDKAAMEVPAPKAGVVTSVSMQEGATCNVGDLILALEVVAEAAPAPVAAPVSVAPSPAAQAPVAAAPVSGGVEDILVPDLSGAADVDVVEVMVKAGDTVAEGDSLIAVETDKAAMEVPAPKAGVVKSVTMQEGATCNVGDLILSLEVMGEAAPAPVAAASAPVAATPAPVATPAPAAPVATGQVASAELVKKNQSALYAGPAVRVLAREFGVDLSQVKGSGRRNRILKEDVQAFVKAIIKQVAAAPKAQLQQVLVFHKCQRSITASLVKSS